MVMQNSHTHTPGNGQILLLQRGHRTEMPSGWYGVSPPCNCQQLVGGVCNAHTPAQWSVTRDRQVWCGTTPSGKLESLLPHTGHCLQGLHTGHTLSHTSRGAYLPEKPHLLEGRCVTHISPSLGRWHHHTSTVNTSLPTQNGRIRLENE